MPLMDLDLATAKAIFDVNVFGLVAVTQACSPMLVAAKGKVINMSSVKSRAAIPYTGTFFLLLIIPRPRKAEADCKRLLQRD